MADDEIRSGSGSPDPSSPPPPGRITRTEAATPPPSSSQRKDPVETTGGAGGGRPSGGGGGGGGREDCWSERETDALIDAWGEKHLELSRGNLKQKQWEEVAEVVSTKEDSGKTPKTYAQCRNRIATVKRKYNQERERIANGGGGRSSWVFYDKLHRLIGSTAKIASSPHMGRTSNLYHQDVSEDSGDSLPPKRVKRERGGGSNMWREMSGAIMRFTEAYEEVENAKMKLVVEMEKERLKFLKELELQRMQFFEKVQLELAQRRQQGRRVGDDSDNGNNVNDVVNDSNNDDDGN